MDWTTQATAEQAIEDSLLKEAVWQESFCPLKSFKKNEIWKASFKVKKSIHLIDPSVRLLDYQHEKAMALDWQAFFHDTVLGDLVQEHCDRKGIANKKTLYVLSLGRIRHQDTFSMYDVLLKKYPVLTLFEQEFAVADLALRAMYILMAMLWHQHSKPASGNPAM